jgi:hypothetical protein
MKQIVHNRAFHIKSLCWRTNFTKMTEIAVANPSQGNKTKTYGLNFYCIDARASGFGAVCESVCD